ncbi:MAG: helix-turn-helix domain-containing protein [Candidatus Methanofastidiosa archaeon]|nr:helix-turn-helix domain-containing protein [Candidatus Methanofastidiosa archaeon]
MKKNNTLVGTKETANILGVSVSTVRRWANKGTLPCYRIGESRYRKFKLSEIEKIKKEYYGNDFISTSKPIIPNINKKLITKNIVASSHPAHYLMHKYWGRKPHNVVNEYISFFSKEGDTILEPFMGSGVTVIEAIKLNRMAIGIDINPMSKFIVENSIRKINFNDFTNRYNEILQQLNDKYSYLYDTECPSCNKLSRIEVAVWENDKLDCIKGICPSHGAFRKKATNLDIKKYNDCQILKRDLLEKHEISYPTDNIMKYVKRSGRTRIDELFSDRALIILSKLLDLINETEDDDIKQLLLFCFTSMLPNVSRMLPGDKEKCTYRSGWVISKFWTPKVHAERNIFHCFNLRYNAILRGKKELLEINPLLCELHTKDSSNLSFIDSESIDYIFTDPPYGESIAYLALSQFWNSWLETDVSYEDEIIIDPYRDKIYDDYSERTKKTYKELYRVLKDKHFMSFTFHNRDLNVWKAILDACNEAGFILENIILQEQAVSSGTQGINKKNTLTGDFIYTFKKDTQAIQNTKITVDAESFIRDCINEFIESNNGATPSELYEYIIPIIVQNNAYTDIGGNAINIENILKSSFQYVKISTDENNEIGGGYKWMKQDN